MVDFPLASLLDRRCWRDKKYKLFVYNAVESADLSRQNIVIDMKFDEHNSLNLNS